MNIIEVKYCPDGTSFDMRSLEPDIKVDGLHIYSGRGSRRSWGTPGNTSIVMYNDDCLTAIHVSWWHKYHGGQAWRYYRNGVKLASWKYLEEPERLLVLDAFLDPTVPSWIKRPGKLTRDYIRPHEHNQIEYDNGGNILAYKWLAHNADGYLVSPVRFWSDSAIWANLELTADYPPAEDNSNGIYCAKTPHSPILQDYRKPGYVLVQLLLSGIVIEANYGYRAEHAAIISTLEEL